MSGENNYIVIIPQSETKEKYGIEKISDIENVLESTISVLWREGTIDDDSNNALNDDLRDRDDAGYNETSKIYTITRVEKDVETVDLW